MCCEDLPLTEGIAIGGRGRGATLNSWARHALSARPAAAPYSSMSNSHSSYSGGCPTNRGALTRRSAAARMTTIGPEIIGDGGA